MSSQSQALSFARDIRPLFRTVDIDHMKPHGLDLSSYDDVKRHASAIYDQVSQSRMPPPPDTSWPPNRVQVFKTWIDDGMQP